MILYQVQVIQNHLFLSLDRLYPILVHLCLILDCLYLMLDHLYRSWIICT